MYLSGGHLYSSGHGHVVPRIDASVADCGGPSICESCRLESMEADEAGVLIPFTSWDTITDGGRVVHNHIDHGFDRNDAPTPRSDMQKSWPGKKWHKEYSFMSRRSGIDKSWRTVPLGNE